MLSSAAKFVAQNDQLVVTAGGVRKLLLALDSRKGHLPDGLSPALLKSLAPHIDDVVAEIVSYSYLETGQVRMDWKTANVVLIFKQKDSWCSELNYHPILLTSIISNLVEHITAHDIH